MTVQTKPCRVCEQPKPLTAFYRHKHSADGRMHICGPCHQDRKRDALLRRPAKPPTPRTKPAAARPDLRWQAEAACRSEDLELFFAPDKERSADREVREAEAKRICAGCPVRVACLDYAVTAPERSGIYGGMNELQRASEASKRCTRCHRYRPLTDFHRGTVRNKGGRKPQCKDCVAETRRDRVRRPQTVAAA